MYLKVNWENISVYRKNNRYQKHIQEKETKIWEEQQQARKR